MQGQEQFVLPEEQPVAHKIQVSPHEKLQLAINLAKRMPPSKIKKNMIGLIQLAPQIEEGILQKIQLPLQIQQIEGVPFLKTQFNRDGDSYRSPFSNKYYPEKDGYKPNGFFREMQQKGATLFQQYTKLYYGTNCISNFYVNQGIQNGYFSFGFFAKKNTNDQQGFSGNWDSFNIVDIIVQDHQVKYKLTSTVLVEMEISNKSIGYVNLTGFLKKFIKQQKRQLKNNLSDNQKLSFHLAVAGQLIQGNQTELRQHLQAVYTAKTKQVIFNARLADSVDMQDHKRKLAKQLQQIHILKGKTG